MKAISAKWINARWPLDFAWQAGYGAFSVGVRETDQMMRYIQDQAEHHRSVSFQVELREILREAGLSSMSGICGINEGRLDIARADSSGLM